MTLDLPTSIPKGLDLTLYKDGPIQKFVDSDLQAKIAKAAAMIPADKHVGVLGVANTDGAVAAAVARVGGEFTIMMAGEKEWRKPGVKAELAVLWTPF